MPLPAAAAGMLGWLIGMTGGYAGAGAVSKGFKRRGVKRKGGFRARGYRSSYKKRRGSIRRRRKGDGLNIPRGG